MVSISPLDKKLGRFLNMIGLCWMGKFSSSVTRWLDYFSIFDQSQQWNLKKKVIKNLLNDD